MNTISKKNKSTYVFRKDPMGQAATVLYIACVSDENRMSQKKRVDAAGMDPATIRSRLSLVITCLQIVSVDTHTQNGCLNLMTCFVALFTTNVIIGTIQNPLGNATNSKYLEIIDHSSGEDLLFTIVNFQSVQLIP
ncbi:MAG: hypothetical protein WA941_07860 [Nitrososphaeraceae archaeon]